MNTVDESAKPVNQAAPVLDPRKCAKVVAGALFAVLVVIVVLGLFISHYDAIRFAVQTIRNTINAGWIYLTWGRAVAFWSLWAVAMGAVSVCAWSWCCAEQCGDAQKDQQAPFWRVFRFALVVYGVALAATACSFESFDGLSTYQAIAFVVVLLPPGAVIVVFWGIGLWAVCG